MTPTASAPPSDLPRKFSDVLVSLASGDSPHLTLREMIDAFGERAFGAMLLVLALLALFPWPPGGKAVFSVPIILLSVELVFQKARVWLPQGLLDRRISRPVYARLLNAPVALPRWVRRRVITRQRRGVRGWLNRSIAATPSTLNTLRVVRAAERLTRPRWPVLTSPAATSLIGAICIAMAVMMALPVPFGDMLPGLAIALLALGMTQRDGMFILVGAGFAGASAIYMMLIWHTVVAIFTGIGNWVMKLF